MNENELKEKRSRVYDVFRDSCNVSSDFGFVINFELHNNLLSKIQKVVSDYIIFSLNSYYSESFEYSDDFLQKYKKEIFNLPNMTPNGVLFPKTETVLHYNAIHLTLIKTLKELKIFDKLKYISIFNIRIVDGEDNDDFKAKRSYATTKIHSDAWVGHRGDAVLSIPLLGDVENTGLNLYEPLGVDESFLEYLPNFDDGEKLYTGLNYLCKMTSGNIHIFDHLCAHKTTKNGLVRVSMEMGIVTTSKEARDTEFAKDERFNYYANNIYSEIGITKCFSSNQTLKECEEIYKGGICKEPSKLKLIDLKD